MNKEQKKLLITILIIIAAAGTLGYFCWKGLEKKELAHQAFLAEEARLSDIRSKKRQIPRLKAEIEQLMGKIEDYERTLPSAKEAEETLKLIQVLLIKTGINIDSLAPSAGPTTRRRGVAPTKTGPYTRHEFKMVINGDFHQLGEFISGLEHLKRFTTIEEMQISSGTEGLKVNMTVVTYSFKGGKA